MPPPIELALSSLLPTVSFLPPDLISFASSLLAQSRSKASSLRPEEEIARTYACAHLACERLKSRLDLDLARPAPPVQPRVYEKLYKYLDGALGGSAATTPRRRRGIATPITGEDHRRSGPEKTPTLARGAPATAKRTREADTLPSPSTFAQAVPDFAMPLIRTLCKALDTPAAAPHVLVGATAVLEEIASRNVSASGRKRKKTTRALESSGVAGVDSSAGGVPVSKWPSLLTALCRIVVAKMQGVEEVGERERVLEALRVFCEERKEKGLFERGKSFERDIDFYELEAQDSGWLAMDWYENVPLGTTAEEAAEEELEDDGDEDGVVTPRKKRAYDKTPLRRKEKHGGGKGDEGDSSVGAAGLLPGFGTMFQPSLDWLSDERRTEYARWKREMVREIAVVEQTS